MKLTAVIISRNDNYGGHLNERATYAINSAIETYDEVIYVDWNSETHSMLYDIEQNLQYKGNLKHIVIPPDIASALTMYDSDAQKCCEVLARNIGIRRATGDYIVSTNIDIIQPKREDIIKLIEEKGYKDFFTTVSRREVEWDYIKNFQGGEYNFSNWSAFREDAYKTSVPRDKLEKTTPGDEYSIINCCGDFQLAPLNVWHSIKGFEEELIYPLYADTNVQKKAKQKGYTLTGQFSPPLFHINHGSKGWGGGGYADGVNKKANDIVKALSIQQETTNKDTWGFSNIEIEYETF
jgi:hypothetical protein